MTNKSAAPQFNSATHGCCTVEVVILANESKEDFLKLEAAWLQRYQSRHDIDVNLTKQVVAADWLNQRSTRTYAQVEAQIFAEEPNPLNWTEAHHKTLTRFARYRTANQNAFKRALKMLEDFVFNRAKLSMQHERLQIAQSRQQVYELKNASFDELIRRQADLHQKKSMAKLQQEIDQLQKS